MSEEQTLTTESDLDVRVDDLDVRVDDPDVRVDDLAVHVDDLAVYALERPGAGPGTGIIYLQHAHLNHAAGQDLYDQDLIPVWTTPAAAQAFLATVPVLADCRIVPTTLDVVAQQARAGGYIYAVNPPLVAV